jgi:beta-lactamase class A
LTTRAKFGSLRVEDCAQMGNHSSLKPQFRGSIMKLLTASLLVGLLIASCSRSVSTHLNASGGNHNTGSSQSQERQNRELQNQIEQIASAAKGKVGVAAVVLEEQKAEGSRQKAEGNKEKAAATNSDGQLLVSLNPREHFPMQSVYKLPIGMAVMKQVDAGKIRLDQKVRVTKSDFINPGQYSPIRDKNPNGTELTVNELIEWMLLESDGTASDVLMKLVGGPKVIQAYLSELRITEMIVLNTEKELGRDWQAQYRNSASPDAAVALLRALHERQGLFESAQSLLLKLMTESNTGPKRLKGLLPAGTVVAHKTGTSGSRNGITAATNDIGIITLPNGRHLAIAVFVSDSPADEATREGVIAKIAKAVWDEVQNREQ